MTGEIDHMLHRLLGQQQLLLGQRAGDDRQRHGVVGRPDRIGHPGDHVIKGGGAVGGDIAHQGDDLVLRAIHGRQLVGGGAQRPPRAQGDDDGMLGFQPALQFGGRRLRHAQDRRLRGRIGRDDLAKLEAVFVLEPLGELEAMGDGMIEANLDQPAAHRQRYQPLGRLAGDAQLAGDLILGIAGDVIEPAGPGCVVEPVRFQLRCFRHVSPSSLRRRR